MGAWGPGNFDNDTAMDFVHDVSKTLAAEMAPREFVEDIDITMAGVAMRLVLVKYCHGPVPDREEIENLRKAILEVYDRQIDGLAPKPDYKKGRRAVMDETFRELLRLIDDQK